MIRWLQDWVQDSTLLRVFLFLRVKAPFSNRYTWIFPLMSSISVLVVILAMPNDIVLWNDGGFVSKFIPVLSVVFPFYVAALAAVSTFAGNGSINSKFPLDRNGRPVTMIYRGNGGVLYHVEITQRHYLSLLFGYCAVLSLVLLIFVAVSSVLSSGIKLDDGAVKTVISNGLLFIFSILFAQLVSLTMLAVYYLSDKIHRPIEPTGDELLLESKKRTTSEVDSSPPTVP